MNNIYISLINSAIFYGLFNSLYELEQKYNTINILKPIENIINKYNCITPEIRFIFYCCILNITMQFI